MKNNYSKLQDQLQCWANQWSKKLFLLGLMFMIVFCTHAQTKKVKGVVSSYEGSTLPGVTILVKGTTIGTISDIDGNYSVDVANDQVLVYSFLGFISQEIQPGDRSVIDVTLDLDVSTLEELIVVGYGESRKSDLTAAQTSISSEDISRTVNTTIDQAIAGRSAGVFVTQNTGAPGGGISVRVRGLSSIGGSNEPLYVIDGIQIQGENTQSGTNPLSSLNPDDVASIEILQGPSATAIFGSRGTNGVVLITTKTGKAGDVRISYAYTYSLQTTPKSLDLMNLRQYAQMDNDYKQLTGATPREEFEDPSLLGEGTDWQNELFNNAAMQKHQFSISGGSDKTTYYLSGENLAQEGVAVGSGFDRTSLRLNMDTKVKDWFSIGARVNVSQTDEQLASTGSNLIETALRLAPQIPVRNIDGSYGGGDPNDAAEQFAPANPIALGEITTNDRLQRRLLGGLNAKFRIIDGLEFITNFNTDFGYTSVVNYLPNYEFGNGNEEASLTTRENRNTYWNWSQTLQYVKQLGKHRINAMVTHEAQTSNYNNLSATRTGFPTNGIFDLDAGDAETASNTGGQGDWAMESYLGRINYNYDDRYIITAAFRADGSSNFGPENKWGYFPSVSAAYRISEENFFNIGFISDFRLRYEIGLTGNQGGAGPINAALSSSTPTDLGVGFRPANYANPDYAWEETKTNNFGFTLGLFDSRIQIDADYYIRSTDNLILQSELPTYLGANGVGAPATPVLNIGSMETTGWAVSLSTVNIDRNNFKWESNLNLSSNESKITSLSAGATNITQTGQDFFLKNYAQRSVIGESPWQFFGYEQEGVFGSIEEIEASALPADGNGEEYPVGENSIWVGDIKYKDQLTEDTDGDGKPDAGDGVIDEKDLTFIGDPFPELYGGFTNTFSYKAFSLSILISGSYGNDVYNYLRYQNSDPNQLNLGQNMFVEAFDYARIGIDADGNPFLENPNTTVARLTDVSTNGNYDRLNDKFVEDGSYLRVKNITLSYQLPSSLLERQSVVRDITLSASAQNVYTLTNYTGYDPEVGSFVGDSQQQDVGNFVGVDFGRYPATAVYSFGIKVNL